MTVWIDDKLAVTPMPFEDELEDLAQTFNAVAVLVEEWELDYDLQTWDSFSVHVKHLPIPDLGTPGIDELYELIEWIKEETEGGNAVLVHCVGGIGRSGMVAAAYLIANGFEVDDAVKQVKARVCGALEIDEQVELVRTFALR
ncbi:MAG: dual specificity protein phosphatase family protein [Methanomicrobia archaeon]|nr:dual specificity protein phosphatase family protein [Methanomicrobia archaeon]